MSLVTPAGSDADVSPAIAEAGYVAVMKGEGDVVAGLKTRIQAALAAATTQSELDEQHRQMAETGKAPT